MGRKKSFQIDPIDEPVNKTSHPVLTTLFALIVAGVLCGAVWFFGFSEWGFAWSGNTAKIMTSAPVEVVTNYPSVTLTMDQVALILEQGATATLKASMRKNSSSLHLDTDDLIMRWHSENPNVASVNQRGKVKALNPGTARIIVTVSNDDVDSNTVYCLVTVKNKAKQADKEKKQDKR